MSTNDGRFQKGEHKSPATEFVKGQIPWNKGISHSAVLGEKHGKWKGGKPDCQDCGRKLATYTSKRCRECYKVSPERKEHAKIMVQKRGDQRGSKSPRWKGGVTSSDRLERIKFRKQLHAVILDRDNYTCQICQEYGGNLQVDHIQSWAEYPEHRFDVDNCRTLCMACHYYVTFKKKIPQGIIWGHNLSRRIAS